MSRKGKLLLAVACLTLLGTDRGLAADEPVEPELLGIVTVEQILKISPQWQSIHDAYDPYPRALASIRDAAAAAPGEITLEVILGSWCSDSREQIPKLIKVLEQAGAGAIPVIWRGVHKAREKREERVAQLRLTAIPTILVSRKGTEIGRIVETPQASIEEDLAAILRKP